MSAGSLRIGTSGWHYKHWREVFYPGGVPQKAWLGFYAESFDTTEINNSFYHLPLASTFDGWRAAVPEGFLFAVKGSRYITHLKKLHDTRDAVAELLGRVGRLGGKAGPVLFQLPPHFRPDPDRLAAFLASLPDRFRYAFEFRDPGWFVPEVYSALRGREAALCVFDRGGQVSPCEVTAGFVYVRFHGGTEAGGGYGDGALRGWADTVRGWRRSGRDVYAYFNNDGGGFALRDARTLRGLLEGG